MPTPTLDYSERDWQNGFEATLDDRIDIDDDYIPMTPVPTAAKGRLVIEDTSKENFEVITYTSKDAGGVFIGVEGARNEDGTSSGTHARGSRVVGNATAQDFQDWRNEAIALRAAFNAHVSADIGSGWTSLVTTASTVATNGNRSFNLSLTGDHTATLSRGMRLRIPRTGTTPTQCADFNGTTQSASRASGSVSGISVSNLVTVEARVYVKSYATGNPAILSRYTNAASGWVFGTDSNGVPRLLFDTNATTADTLTGVASLPLNEWVHYAATINTTGGTGKIWINGVEVPSTYSNGTTTTTANTANLVMGATAEPGDYANMRISEVRLWSTARTDDEIKNNMNQELTGSETGLMGYWKLNGDFNDSTSNANHLTANSGVTATYADNALNANAYAIIMTTPVYSGGNTTMTVQTPIGYPIPNATLGTVSYSSVKVPYGFPSNPGLWSIHTLLASNLIPAGVAGTWTNLDVTLKVPAGVWNLGYRGTLYISKGATTNTGTISATLSTSSSSETDMELRTSALLAGASATLQLESSVSVKETREIAALTTYYMLVKSSVSTTASGFAGGDAPLLVKAEPAYL